MPDSNEVKLKPKSSEPDKPDPKSQVGQSPLSKPAEEPEENEAPNV